MRYDLHAHIGRFDGRSVAAEDLAAYIESGAASRVVFSNLNAASKGPDAQDVHEPDANLASLAVNRVNPRLLPLYWVRTGQFDSDVQAYAGALDAEPFVGAMFAPELNGYEIDGDALNPYVGVLADLKRTAFVRTSRADEGRPTRVYALARRHPRVAFVLCGAAHKAHNAHWREALDCVERSVKRRDARLYLTTSYASVDEIVEAIKLVGDDHVLWGTDATLGANHGSNCRALLEELAESVGSGSLERLVRETAERLLHVPQG